MADAATVTIGSPELQAEISPRGAELVRLRTAEGHDLLWDGDLAFWSGRAPILFPIVGRLKDDTAVVDGVAYTMKQHGLARISTFIPVERDTGSITMRLVADAATKKLFPFAFTLDVVFRVKGRTLSIDIVAYNTGTVPMPVAAGFHPAFRWPLPGGGAKLAHTVTFEKPEPEPIRQVVGGLLTPAPRPTPVRGATLALDDDLFRDDALIWLAPHSRSVRFGVDAGPHLRIDFPGMPQLGIWTKPGAGFLCIEPWSGYASPEGFTGELADKPGSVSLRPGETRNFGMAVTWEPAAG